MYKKFFIALTFVLSLLATQINFCQAMPYSEMYLGGLTIGSTADEMRRIYGEPVSGGWNTERGYDYSYNGAYIHCGSFSGDSEIYEIVIRENNCWKTPSGLGVGDNISKALDLYGQPDYTQTGNFKTAYCYFNKRGDNLDFGFIILFNKDSGKILLLSLGNSSRYNPSDYEFQDRMEYWLK